MLRTAGTLLLLLAALPANLVVTGLALLRRAPAPGAADQRRTVMISGGKMTKALQLARSFHAAGHRVVLVESRKYRLTGHRFSRAVDRFHTVPEPQDPGYAAALLRIVRAERVDVYVPVSSPVASVPDADAMALLAPFCEVVHVGPDLVRRLDDKHEFARIATSLGLRVPDTHRITRPEQVTAFDFRDRRRSYILKSLAYDPVRRLDLTRLPCATPAETAAFVHGLPISEDNPWILQEFVPGQEYCTHSTVRDGVLRLHCCCASSAFQINYAMVDKPEITAWVERLVGALGLTGQVSLDFIEAADDGCVYAIECNPRTHSAITLFHDHPGVAGAYLDADGPLVQPLASARPTYWLYHEVWRMLTRPHTARERLAVVARGRDAIFDPTDPLPFLMVHHAQVPWLLLRNLVRRRPFLRVDFNIGKLIEPGGD